MNVKQLIPKEQRELIINALEAYQRSLNIAIARHKENGLGDVLHHDVFDITGLIGMMKYDVEIALPKTDRDGFCFVHGVDFPDYGETIMAKYPIFEKPKDEYLTIITGTISFIDDGVHGRSASIQHINSIDRVLKGGQSEEVLDEIENNGDDYIVVEEYDGLIEIDIVTEVKDTRVYQLIDIAIDKTEKQTFDELVEAGIELLVVDKLKVGDSYEVHKEEVYILRIK